MELLIKYLKNWWSQAVIPTIATLIRKHRENTEDIISAVEKLKMKQNVSVDFSVLEDKMDSLSKVFSGKEMTVNVEGTTIEMQPVTDELKAVIKGLKSIEKKIPKAEKQKFIDYTDKLDKLIELSGKDDTEIKKLQEIATKLGTSEDLIALAEWLKVIAEKEAPEFSLPLDKYGRVKVAVDKVGGGGGGLTSEQEQKLNSLSTEAKQDEIITAIENITVTAESAPAKPTDAYGYCASSETEEYSYVFFEDKDDNWYIMRENITTEVVDYTKGTGGYDSVFVDKDSAPSGSHAWSSYGNTF